MKEQRHENSVTIWAMRHGPTRFNLEHRIQGNIDTDIEQEEINSYFERIGADVIPQPDTIIVSGLRRTHQTARALQSFRGWPEIPLQVEQALNERKWGVFEKKYESDARGGVFEDPKIRTQYPQLQSVADVDALWDHGDFKVEGGESINEVAARVRPRILALATEYPGKSLLLVLHAGVLISLGIDYKKISHFRVGDTAKEVFEVVYE